MIENSVTGTSEETNSNRFAGLGDAARGGWLGAIIGLIESRAGIISLEAKEVLGNALAKLALLLIGLFCAITAWVLIVAASIGALTSATKWNWYQVTFAMAGLHLFIALVGVMIAKKSFPNSFPVTRSEFKKDREWLNQLKNRND